MMMDLTTVDRMRDEPDAGIIRFDEDTPHFVDS